MIYTVAEVSEQLKISKVSIYNKLKTKAFKNITVKKQGKTYINDIGFNLIKNDYINFLKEQIKELNKKLTAEQELHRNTYGMETKLERNQKYPSNTQRKATKIFIIKNI